MTTQQFRRTNFRADTLRTIAQANSIIEEYDGQRLTVRQLYYQFVSRDLIPNTPRSYQNLTSILADGRYAGLVSWDAIEDRGREPDVPGQWSSIDRIIDIAVRQFRLPRWADQDHYVELWVEKQALAGVLSPIADRHHVPLMVNKGYSSASAMKASADRMLSACKAEVKIVCDNCEHDYEDQQEDDDGRKTCWGCQEKTGPRALAVRVENEDGESEITKQVVVLYLGDHDPSGKDMIRDIEDRLREFGVPNLSVVSIGLTTAQVRKFKPPPNPAKLTDSRAKAYIEEFGPHSWEVDALPPRVLNAIVDTAIGAVVDRKKMDAVIAQEEKDRNAVMLAISKMRGENAKPKKGKRK